MSAELTVLDRTTGEVIDLATAPTATLAEFCSNLANLRSELSDAERAVHDALLDRMDLAASWTMREGCYEIKAPSPAAGSESYDPAILERELRKLIEEGVIGEEAADRACVRRVTLSLQIPWDVDLAELAKTVKGLNATVAHAEVLILDATPSVNASLAGIKALAKVPAAGEALATARLQTEPPPRRVKVTVKS